MRTKSFAHANHEVGELVNPYFGDVALQRLNVLVNLNAGLSLNVRSDSVIQGVKI